MRLTSVDFFKLFFAVCIVAIHTYLLNVLQDQYNWFFTHIVLRLGVPYFFVASGYFWGLKVNKEDADPAYVKQCRNNYAKKNLPPFFFWSFWGLLFFAVRKLYTTGISAVPLIIKTGLFYPLGAMWFVSSCIVAVVIIAAIRNKNKLLLVLGWGGYLFALICNTYYFVICDSHIIKTVVDLYMNIFISARNGLFVGLLFVGLGFLLSKKDNFIKRMKTKYVVILFVLFYAMLAMETIYTFGKLTADDNSLFLTLPIVTVLLFELTLRMKVKDRMGDALLESRRMSVNIYYLHPFFVQIIRYLAILMDLNPVIYFIIITSICLITYRLTRSSSNKFVRLVLP